MRTISSPSRARTGASRAWRTVAALTGATTALALLLPGGVSSAQTRVPAPDLKSLVAQAKQLTYQINALSEQYDGLRIQLSSARVAARKAEKAAAQDAAALKASQSAVGRLASASYMNAGYDPILELFTSSNPEQFLGQASITQQLDQENGNRVTGLKAAEAADARARATAQQQIAHVTALQAAMSAKSQEIQSEIDKINSSAMQQAMAIFNQTGQYPNINIPGSSSVGAVALRYALSRRGDPYVWGAAGPSEFDCSGLVMWAYAQEGISLPHYTGSQWDMGQHISRSQLEPGDLVFFFADISHVGLYIGNGLMVDAPAYGQDVQVQPVPWDVYVGAVRIEA
ncbi:MAG TPA: NlpC/P60 family protein [Streptosporangiaceae bacterium]|nr:NlpC/P60 family protein [Streptosporangiaceae bacterium]